MVERDIEGSVRRSLDLLCMLALAQRDLDWINGISQFALDGTGDVRMSFAAGDREKRNRAGE